MQASGLSNTSSSANALTITPSRQTGTQVAVSGNNGQSARAAQNNNRVNLPSVQTADATSYNKNAPRGSYVNLLV